MGAPASLSIYQSMRLLLTRHGETTWNLEGRIQGHRGTGAQGHGDSDPTPLGLQQGA
jgi:broad specificity phosphatase PhoE